MCSSDVETKKVLQKLRKKSINWRGRRKEDQKDQTYTKKEMSNTFNTDN